MRSTILRPRWTEDLLRIRQHEYGVQVNEECGDFSPVGAEVRVWVEDNREHGWGQSLSVHDVLRRVEWHWFGAWSARERRQVKHDAIAFLVRLLNDPRSGLTVVPLKHRCSHCGGAA
ncbi:hypothetical protein JIG36_37435 [Actinoplanes sp. LDG1-06]|uniref:Uncharacterized protein n=1 Tax=Paractinoplanes ovalisporus TaxID=2810368 RepID=A0ABS2APN8_9ACTN|nr:hypothetical protein [Actinoplanes ovalisporus]MBM2621201.1 hypothetical protein [Actinoplanes ovalisporus]